jgi:hypothetical protein
MLTLSELRRWTPVALNLNDPEPSIDWCDMTGERFSDPFFDETVARLVQNGQGRSIVRTPLGALFELDEAPSLEPCGLIFHVGRCGSTLVGRLLSLVPGVVTVLEARPINNFLEADLARFDESAQVQILQRLVRALGRVRFGDERRLVIKLSSWNVRKVALFRRAFPAAPIIWVQRRPVEVMASMLKDPPAWLAVRNHPAKAAQFFGFDPAVVAGVDGFEFAARLLASMLDAAAESDAWVIDYDDLPGAVPDIVAPLFGIDINTTDRAAMEEQARYHSKSTGAVPFTDDSERKRAVPERVTAVSALLLDERYALLNERRLTQYVNFTKKLTT